MKNLLLLLPFFLLSCSSTPPKENITISTNEWIGYTPLYYAYETGALTSLNIKLINSVSLAEAADVYRVGQANMVTTTQHEYNSLKKSTNNITPIILLDRSNGGDMVLSNRSIKTLQKSKKIYAYLEVDSINQEILKDFIADNSINLNTIEVINRDQEQIQAVNFQKLMSKDLLIVTYTPYNISLKKRGFHAVASTKNINGILVIDALCAKNSVLSLQKPKLQELKKVLDDAIETIKTNPKKAHKIVAKYLSDISYKEFINSLESIKWINKPSDELLEHIEKHNYSKETLLK